MIEDVFTEVKDLMGDDADGHGARHVERVLNLALRFAEQEGADTEVVALAALLHDVDDYKIFGAESAENLTNAHAVLKKFDVNEDTTRRVIEVIRSMGYNKYLENIRPVSIEGMVVSDADMCDAIGAQGILRTHAYNLSIGSPFFDKGLEPVSRELSAAEYKSENNASSGTHSVQHFMDKLLVLPSIMLTESGRVEASKRKMIMIDFLYQLFEEEESNAWKARLDSFLKQQNDKK
jgi:uncharacterized protein